MVYKWKNCKYPKWYTQAFDECRYEFKCGNVDDQKTIDAFSDEWTKYRVYQLYRYLKGEIKCPPFIGEDARLKKVKLFSSGGSQWSGVKEAFLSVCVSSMNSSFWSRCEYELWDNGEKVESSVAGKPLPFSGFYATVDDVELNSAWENVFQWFMDEPWINLSGSSWKKNRMEQL